MNVYILDAEADDYSGLNVPDEGLYDLTWRFLGEPLRDSWSDIELDVFEGHLPEGDFPSLIANIPVFTPRAADALRDLLEANGELLPAHCEGKQYYLYNVTCLLDALDEENSELDRFDDGRVMEIDKYSFLDDKLKGAVIFKLPQDLPGWVYVTDPFVERVESAGLKGFRFPHLWTTA